jgi:hypothetical protein
VEAKFPFQAAVTQEMRIDSAVDGRQAQLAAETVAFALTAS